MLANPFMEEVTRKRDAISEIITFIHLMFLFNEGKDTEIEMKTC